MKKVFVYVACLMLFACVHRDEAKQAQVPETSTEELAKYFNMFDGKQGLLGVLSLAFDSIESEYPSMLRDIVFLKSDSIKGLNIDCIGMLHSSPYSSGVMYTSDSVSASQNRIAGIIDKGGYDFVGTEYASTPGRIDFATMIKEQQSNVSSLAKTFNAGSCPSFDDCRKFIIEQAKSDYSAHLIVSGSTKPYLIGTEPRWVWLSQQMLLSILLSVDPSKVEPELIYTFDRVIGILARVRSEIAYVRTARYLIKVGRHKKAAILYGRDHLVDFINIQIRYGTTGKIL